MHGNETITVSGTVFADGMYEGDLMAAEDVKSQIGRESCGQYGEPHAGVIYTKERHKESGQRGFPKAADEGTLNIRYNSHATAEIVEPPSALFGNDEVNGVERSATGIIDVQLVQSRDGRHWHRCSDRSPVIPLGPHPYEAGSIFGLCNTPVIVGDEMWIYYTASTTPHGGVPPEKEQSIARASWRIDGLASLQAKDEPGTIETHDFVPEGRNLFLNVDVRSGKLMVEVLDAAGKAIEGYEKESCVIQSQDSVNLAVQWKKAAVLPAGASIRLRFHLENGDLYGYRID